MEGTFSEIEKVVHEEIPERNDSESQQFREIEIEFQFVVEKVYGGVVDEQPYDRYADKPCVLHGDFGVVAFKCPDTVQQIVACRRTHETDRVGDVFVDAAYVFEKPSNTEVDKYTRTAY